MIYLLHLKGGKLQKSMSSQINVKRSEFRDSYRRHYALYLYGDRTVSLRTRRLILFYSVECGLKSLILKQIGKNTYEDLKLYSRNSGRNVQGHDIKAMTQALGIDKYYPLRPLQLSDKGGSVPVQQFNELWRYGAAVSDEHQEEEAERTLNRIAVWIGERV